MGQRWRGDEFDADDADPNNDTDGDGWATPTKAPLADRERATDGEAMLPKSAAT
ncbi:MAG: hypothetical protein R2856_25990 [Caldilineaceae bacterium]